jgi:multidrug efflux pump subunit AcrB
MSSTAKNRQSEVNQRNVSRFFVESRHIAWVLLVATVVWGVLGYRAMPQRKDPDVAPREALVIIPWPGASAEKIEQLVTRPVEERIAENSQVERITSNTRTGIAYVQLRLTESVTLADRGKQFDDIKLKLDALDALPQGAGPINFVKDFGDTATLLLTIASPTLDALEIELRSSRIARELEAVRQGKSGSRVALVVGFPDSLSQRFATSQAGRFAAFARERGALTDETLFRGPGFVGLDGSWSVDQAAIKSLLIEFRDTFQHVEERHPDVWGPLVVENPASLAALVRAADVPRYTYRELSDQTELIKRALLTLPSVGKVAIAGVLDERVFLDYSQERLASYGVVPAALSKALSDRNITVAGGVIETGGKRLRVEPSGEFSSERELGDMLIPVPTGPPIHLRDVVEIGRGYESPARYLNYYSAQATDGQWQRLRAVTLSIQMRAGEQIAAFDQAVDEKLHELSQLLPEDLVMARTSDQPQQVEEIVSLFMSSLYEAVALVVLVSLIGFWEWRSALVMALSIPLTLAMTFGLMHLLGIDLQQVSIASLIIALGLLVDDPVVAGDAIKRALTEGLPRTVAAWLGPTRLAKAILYATITNIAAYLPFLLLSGDTGQFMYSLPVVIASSLVASRLVSMTFIPLLGYYLLRHSSELPIEERRRRGFGALYYRAGRWAIQQRWKVLAGSVAVLAVSLFLASRLKTEFFPRDLSYLSYVDVWLPEDAPLSETNATAAKVEQIVRSVVQQLQPDQPLLQSLTTFTGGGAPRFWVSIIPEQLQANYAQIVIELNDKRQTRQLIAPLQRALNSQIPGAVLDVRQLETGTPVGIPIAVRISGENLTTLRELANEAKQIFRNDAATDRIRDDWGGDSFALKLRIDPDRATLAGLANLDVAASSAAAMSGAVVATLREGNEQIPIVARMQMDELANLREVRNLFVHSQDGLSRAPLEQISTIELGLSPDRIQRRNQFRTITVQSFADGRELPSEVLARLMPALEQMKAKLPVGYSMELGGEYEEQVKGFKNLSVVMLLSIIAIYLALVMQFQNAIKPLLVFGAIPFGIVGAFFGLWAMGMPFGFMAFLGIASLIGVIVSHIIVMFDFIEEAREHGAPLEQALLDAGILRLRPVLITVGATVIALFPLAANGGPLWEPLCYAQIGGLSLATVVTLLLVPTFYAIAVLDLRIVKWSSDVATPQVAAEAQPALASPSEA